MAIALVAGALQLVMPTPAASAASLVHAVEAESLAVSGWTSKSATAVTFYANGDSARGSLEFAQAGRYTITARGASNGAGAAGMSVYVGDTKAAAFTFSGTAFTASSAVFDLAQPGAHEVRLTLETDNGSSDTVIDGFDIFYEGPAPALPPAPVPPSQGAYETGNYRNLFQEWDPTLTSEAVTAKLDSYWTSFFTGTDDTKRLYYPAGANANGAMAYIKDTGNDDVRSEGMSYGMMIAVQMNKKAEFDALWNWAKTNMQHKTGARSGYFCWQANFAGSCIDNNPASDGEEYFATALLFAGNRWGDGTGIYDYTDEGNAILNTMLHKEDMNGGVVDSTTNMFNRANRMIVFVPFASAAGFSDPSYHLPAFYELWGRWATGYNGNQAADRQFWLDAAERSREYFIQATDPATGLNPDYAEFDGAPNNTGSHGAFRFDAWRTSVNWAVDYAWWADDPKEKVLTDRLQSFFEGEGMTGYVNQYALDGTPLSTDRSPGLIASTGAASLAATDQRAWKFVEELWKLQPSTGKYRYYDGLLNYMALLHASGNFRIYGPESAEDPDVAAPSAPSALTSKAGTATSVTLSWAASTDDRGVASYTVRVDGNPSGAAGCTAVATTGCTVTGLQPGTSYTFQVTASDAAGNTSAASSALVAATTDADPGEGSDPNRDPADIIEAESYDLGNQVSLVTGDFGTGVSFAGNGSYIRLAGIDFGSTAVTSVQVRAQKPSNGGNIQVSVGSPNSTSSCTIYPDGDNAWHVKSNTCYPTFSGTQDVYITALGPLTIDHISFLPHRVP
ncbi:MAG TPA: glycosyl hydrolase family 8 [Microbacterium sp.]|nr:glycosyl hydrolase family 8 [Microbacterium sp.]